MSIVSSSNCINLFTTGAFLKQSLAQDPLSPVLLDRHFVAIDRRVEIVLQVCVTLMK